MQKRLTLVEICDTIESASNVTVQEVFALNALLTFRELPEVQYRYFPSDVWKAKEPSAVPATTVRGNLPAGASEKFSMISFLLLTLQVFYSSFSN